MFDFFFFCIGVFFFLGVFFECVTDFFVYLFFCLLIFFASERSICASFLCGFWCMSVAIFWGEAFKFFFFLNSFW